MSQALELRLAPNQVDEQIGGRFAANLAKINLAGCRCIGQLFSHHRRHDLRAGQVERPCELGKARCFANHDAKDCQPCRESTMFK